METPISSDLVAVLVLLRTRGLDMGVANRVRLLQWPLAVRSNMS